MVNYSKQVKKNQEKQKNAYELWQNNLKLLKKNQEIQKKARELWQKNGCPPNKDLDFWLFAEKEIKIQEIAYDLWNKHGKPPNRDLDFWLLAEKEYEKRRLLDTFTKKQEDYSIQTPAGFKKLVFTYTTTPSVG